MPRVFDARALNLVRHTLAVTLPYPPRNLPVLQMPDNVQPQISAISADGEHAKNWLNEIL